MLGCPHVLVIQTRAVMITEQARLPRSHLSSLDQGLLIFFFPSPYVLLKLRKSGRQVAWEANQLRHAENLTGPGGLKIITNNWTYFVYSKIPFTDSF